MELTILETVKNKIVEIRDQKVILDSDIAELYQVETKRINEAVKNNPDKFPDGYMFELLQDEWDALRSKISTSIKGGRTYIPRAFTEKGFYMLATVLKSPRATETTIAIIEAFSKVREINRSIVSMLDETNDASKQEALTNCVGTLIGELIMPPDEELETISIETEAKLKFLTMLEISRKTIKRPKLK